MLKLFSFTISKGFSKTFLIPDSSYATSERSVPLIIISSLNCQQQHTIEAFRNNPAAMHAHWNQQVIHRQQSFSYTAATSHAPCLPYGVLDYEPHNNSVCRRVEMYILYLLSLYTNNIKNCKKLKKAFSISCWNFSDVGEYNLILILLGVHIHFDPFGVPSVI